MVSTVNSRAVPAVKPIAISFNVLLGLYLVIPLCLAIYLVDNFLFGAPLKASLPTAPEHLFLFSILFGTPHIIASNVILFSNGEYIRLYRQRLLLLTLGIITFFAVGSLVLPYNAMFAIVATITITHVVKQQIGIANSVARQSGLVYNIWFYSVILAAIVLYNAIFLRDSLSGQQRYDIGLALMAFTVVILAAALYCHRHMHNQAGRSFLWANTVMVLASLFFHSQQYWFLAIIAPRFIHDITAFVFYVVHDHNRHLEGPRNWLYRAFGALRVNAFIAVPALAILLTFLLQHHGDQILGVVTGNALTNHFPRAMALGFIGYLGLVHYYTEAVTWKGKSPYRRYISFQSTVR